MDKRMHCQRSGARDNFFAEALVFIPPFTIRTISLFRMDFIYYQDEAVPRDPAQDIRPEKNEF